MMNMIIMDITEAEVDIIITKKKIVIMKVTKRIERVMIVNTEKVARDLMALAMAHDQVVAEPGMKSIRLFYKEGFFK